MERYATCSVQGRSSNARGGLRDGHRTIKMNEGSRRDEGYCENRSALKQGHYDLATNQERPTWSIEGQRWEFYFLIGLCSQLMCGTSYQVLIQYSQAVQRLLSSLQALLSDQNKRQFYFSDCCHLLLLRCDTCAVASFFSVSPYHTENQPGVTSLTRLWLPSPTLRLCNVQPTATWTVAVKHVQFCSIVWQLYSSAV